MGSNEPPEGKCGFVLLPENSRSGPLYNDIESWYEDSRAVSCWRDTWNGTDRCIWHADADDKPLFELVDSRKSGPERIDGAILSNLHLEDRISFNDCALPSADFSSSDFRHGDFRGAYLFGANFEETFLENADFSGAILKDSYCGDSNFFDADLIRANLQFAYLESANLNGAKLNNAKLQFANLRGADCIYTKFDGASFEKTNISGVQMNNASFKDAELSEADFQGLELDDVTFTEANLNNANLSDTRLQGANLNRASLFGVCFNGSNAKNATFTGAFLPDTKFERADLRDADLSGAHLEDASIVQTDLRRADFENARLYQVYFSNNRLNSDTEFGSNCVYEHAKKLNLWDDTPLESETKRWNATATEASVWTYRFLQSLHEEYALMDEARKYHIKKKASPRNLHWEERNFSQWVFHAGNGAISKHGESPWRVIAVSAISTVLFSRLYPMVGGFEGNVSVAGPKWLEQIYFSAVTFTTLGYGDLHPATQASRLLASIEAFLGALLMAYLVFVLGRRTNW